MGGSEYVYPAAGHAENSEATLRADRFSASGIPLAEAFRVVVRGLHRDGPSSVRQLAGQIRASKILTLNMTRIMRTWGSEETQEAFRRGGRKAAVTWDDTSSRYLAKDLLMQLAWLGLAEQDVGHRWRLTEKFDPSERYVLLMRDGKQLTHLRLEEGDVRERRAKLAKARFILLSARDLVREAGVQTQATEEFFAGLTRLLAEENLGHGKKTRGYGPRVVTPDQPADAEPASEGVYAFKRHWRPQDMQACVKCEIPKPLAREFYEVYREVKNGVWYWRRDCKICRKKQKGLKGKLLGEAQNIQLFITRFTEEHGEPPTVRQVCEGTGSHFRTVRAAWKLFAEQDESFPPLPLAARAFLKQAGYRA